MARALVSNQSGSHPHPAISYQSWSIIVPPSSTHFLFTATGAAKFIPSLFDIDDEHRGSHASLSMLPAAPL